MCGFIGKISKSKIDNSSLEECNSNLICRGPDEKKFQTFKINADLNCSLIFNRLAILDLTTQASQPMFDDFGNFLMFNGEIFNHLDLRKKLESKNIRFKTKNSDTEVLLHGLREYGAEFISFLNGQFAIAYFSRKKNELMLIRDRLGQKPLFYFYNKDTLLFSSNLISIIKTEREVSLDENSLDQYLMNGVVSSPNTIFKNFYKLKPAEIITFKLENEITKSTHIYWNLSEFIGEEDFSENSFLEKFYNAVKIRQVADVDVANLLSGGIDSTSILEVLNRNDDLTNFHTYSVISNDSKYDESKYSQLVANKIKSIHKTENISNLINTSIVNESIELFDEPYADPSTIPSYVLYKSISNKFKAAVSGDGGDELLGGYDRIYNTLNRKGVNDKLIKNLFKLYPANFGSGYNILKESKNLNTSYLSHYSDYKFFNLFRSLENYRSPFNNQIEDMGNDYKSLILFDYKFYLPEMMMLKIDRTSMANSVEIRSPFVDHNLVEYVLGSNLNYIKKNDSKRVLKKFLSNNYDEEFIYRSKKGFVFNLEEWIFINENLIKSEVKEGMLRDFLNVNSIDRLLKFKSRINSQRIWKLYFLSIYLRNISTQVSYR